MNFIDTHCHLHFDNYIEDADHVIEEAQKYNVNKMICVGCSLADSQKAVDFANKHEDVWATVGAHPHDGADFMENPDAAKILNMLSKSEKVVAIGEIGLDYFHEYTPREKQIKALRDQIEIGLPTGLPFIFHVRDAFEEFWKVLDEYKNIKGVVHSFSAHSEELEEVLKRDLCVGLNGIMTFTKDELQLEAAKKVPLDKLLLETDAPFLTPKPYRGQRCEPKHVVNTAEFLAKLRGEPLEELASVTTKNAIELFGLENRK
jgi:TatD DNase family protein